MDRAVITIHLPAHRQQSLRAYGESPRLIGEVYDYYIGRYVKYLRELARKHDFRIRTDRKNPGPVFTIDERGRAEKKAAHTWLLQLPDVWEWIT